MENQPQAKIDYPTEWEYKIFTTDSKQLKITVFDIFDKPYHLTESKKSKGGKYESFSLKTEVTDEKERNSYFKALSELECVCYIF